MRQTAGAPNEQRVVWTISRLAPRGTESLTLRVTPTTNAPLDLFVDWTVRPISAVAQIEVQQPQLEMSVFGPKDIAYGEAAKYTIRLTNPGNGSADDGMPGMSSHAIPRASDASRSVRFG